METLRKCVFPQNFRIKKLHEISVFYVITVYHRKSFRKLSDNALENIRNGALFL